MKEDGISPVMPEAGAQYLVNYLFEIGPTMPGAGGPVQITHGEIRAWQENAGIDLQPWEVRLLRRLSLDYLTESYGAAKPGAKPPFGELYRSPNLSKKVDSFLD